MILENSFLNQQDHDIMKIKEKKKKIYNFYVNCQSVHKNLNYYAG